MTIFADLRTLPPDLITPALASAAFMKDIGPEGLPPLLRNSFDERRLEILTPAPEPSRKISPSVLYHSRISSIVSPTLVMKHAEVVGFSSFPTLNQTGE